MTEARYSLTTESVEEEVTKHKEERTNDEQTRKDSEKTAKVEGGDNVVMESEIQKEGGN